MTSPLIFEIADLNAPDVDALLSLHLKEAHADDCTAALGKEALSADTVTLFAARNKDGALVGIAGLKILANDHGEVKSVRTHPDYLRQGVSRRLMAHLENEARKRGMVKLSLETHPTPAYAAACRLYENLGYEYCGAFGEYLPSPKSIFMTKTL
jgi:putative acetyltransferase